MITPTKEKTWTGVYNYSLNSGVLLTDELEADFKIIDTLIACGWTCIASSNRTSYGASRYINSAADIVYYGGVSIGSWIILGNSALCGGTAQLLFYCYGPVPGPSSYRGFISRFSPGGLFTGGTLTAVPTATDQVLLGPDTSSYTSNDALVAANTLQKYLTVMCSTDLQCTRILCTISGTCAFFMQIEKLKNPPANIAAIDNWYGDRGAHGCSWVVDKPTIAYLWSAARGRGYYNASSLTLSCYLTGPSLNAGHLGNLVTAPMPEQSVAGTTWPAWPIGVSAYNVSGSPTFVYEERGQLYDMAWGCASQITGSTHDSAGTKSWVKMGSIWLPWDGSTPMIS